MSEASSPAPKSDTPPPRKVTLYLVRHGQTTYNVEHRLPGQLSGVTLNDVGVRQAERLGEAMREAPLTTVIASPLERARHTAEIVMRGHEVPLHLDERLMDTNVGHWAGQTIDELNKNDPAWGAFVRHPTQPPEGVEGFYEVLARVVAVAETARHDQANGDFIMLVAHADVIKLLITHYLQLPIEGSGWLGVPNASVTTLTFEGEHSPTVVALNWLPSPSWLRPEPPKPEPTAAEATANTSVATANPPGTTT